MNFKTPGCCDGQGGGGIESAADQDDCFGIHVGGF
jgi:hypothetical protein